MTQLLQLLLPRLKLSPSTPTTSTPTPSLAPLHQTLTSLSLPFTPCQPLHTHLPAQLVTPPRLHPLDISALLRIQLHPEQTQFCLQLIDAQGNYIKARSQHHRTALCRYMCTVMVGKGLEFSCNPLTGEIRIGLRYWSVDLGQIEQMLLRVLKCIENNREHIARVLEFLQYLPEPMNNFVEQIAQKMQKCRIVVLGTHQTYKYSKQYQDHGQYLLQPLPMKDIKYSWQDQTNVRIMFQDLTHKLRTKYIVNPLQAKRSNWIFIELKEVEGRNREAVGRLEDIRHTVKNGGNLQFSQFERFDQEFYMPSQANKSKNSEQQNTMLNFMYKGSRRCEQQTRTVQRVSKQNYFKFLRDYFCIKNYQFMNKNYLIRKHEQYTKLHTYLVNNKMTMSLVTKLSLCYELVGIGYTAISTLKKFVPSYQSYDINLCADQAMKLQSVYSYYRNSVVSAQIAQTCYQILYGLRCSSHCLKQIDQQIKVMKWYHTIKTIDDGQAKYQGVSVLTYWLKKVLTDVINNQSYRAKNINYHRKTYIKSKKSIVDSIRLAAYNPLKTMAMESEPDEWEKFQLIEESQKQELEKMLFVISLCYKTYKEVFDDKIPIFDIEM